MDGLDESRNRRGSSENGAPNHRDTLHSNRYAGAKEAIRAAIDYLVPAPAKPADLIAIFDGRANYGMIRNWKYGLAFPPPWAMDLLQRRLNERAAQPLQKAKAIAGVQGPGMGWNKGAKTLAVWRERKARERDAKEKAAEIAALPST